ncbi:hypothetical protein H6P87_01292 [Rickettsia tillamookensis]|uniref:Autotransporter domain-containing protein n=1 Tax=Rickettsia tillamookensis TaxID=2761623 RepID=A0A9E6MJL1_9RICK|nr:autotransporter outer membrane beta-barrel domain-containing protein [Rickettsia tillamookensis]QQV75727.1 hypothetical protein H6P87_01292 [Rickettsia tillamookensis]
MANISPKLFQKAIQKGLKTALFTTSTTAIMLTGSGALGAATIDANATFSTGVGMTPAVQFAGGTLQYTNDGFTVDADEAVNITAIDVNGKAPALFTVNKNISLGSVDINGGAAFPVSISDTFTLTLTGADGLGNGPDTYTGLGAITLNGATAGLTINSGNPGLITLDGTIDSGAAGQGILIITTDSTFTAAIGATKSLASITASANLDATTLAATSIILNNITIETTGAVNGAINLTGAAAELKAGGLVTGDTIFNGDGRLTLSNGITGAVTTAGNNTGTLTVGAGNVTGAIGTNGGNILKQVLFNGVSDVTSIDATTVTINNAAADVLATGVITAAVNFAADGQLIADNGITGAVTTANNNTGTLTVGAGNVTGAIGTNGGNILKQVLFNGVNDVTSIDATTVTINNGAADVRAAGVITAAVNFAADGQLIADNGITGAVTTANNNTGTLTVGAGNVTGAIGTNGGNILKQVLFNGVNDVTSIDATTVTINNGAADVRAAGVITAAVNFAADGALTANNGITGAVTTKANNTGTLTVGVGDVTGAIGTNGGNILKQVLFNGASDVTSIDATTVTINNGAADVRAAGVITAAVNFAADGALTANNGITGAVTTKANNTGTLTVGVGDVTGAIGTNGGNILKQVLFNGASDVTSIDATTVTINNGAADVRAAGVITAAVNFAADGALTANNGITGAVTTKANNTGTLTVGVGDVTGAIGTNGGNILKQVLFNGASDVTSIDATTVTINNGAADVRAAGVITAAVNFAADGALTANNGITGAVTTKANNTGTLTVGVGDVTGAIGTNGGNILKQVLFNGASDVTSIDATTVTINNGAADVRAAGVITAAVNFAADGALTANNGITGAVTTKANNTGTLTVGVGDVTGAIGTNGGNILKQVLFNGASDVTSIDATTVTINNGAADVRAAGVITAAVNFAADGALTANNGITGAVTTKANNTGTLTVGVGDVTGAIGTNGGNILKQVLFNGASDVTSIDATTVTINNGAADVRAAGVITAAVNFAADGQLIADNGITGAVTTANNNTGTLTVGAGNVTGAIGTNGGNILKQVLFNGMNDVTSIDATTVTINNAAADVLATGVITAAVNFAADGQLIADNGITGAVTTANNNTGTLTVGAGNVTGAIGTNGGNILKQVLFNGVSNVTTIDATTVSIGNVAANVTAAGAITSAVSFGADGALTANNGITGAVTTKANNTGTLTVGVGDVTGAIGTNGGNILKQVLFNGASNVTSIDATTVTVNNAATNVKAAQAITAAVNFAADGALTANNGITGAVTAAGGNGTLTTAGVGVTGAVGTNAASLKVLNAKVNNGAADLVFGSDIYAQTVNFDDIVGGGAVGTIKVGGNLVATTVNFSADVDGGTLEFNGPGGNTYNLSGAITNGATGILNINAGGTVIANDASIGTVAQINIQNNKSFAINAKNADVDILNAQAINFKGANSNLFLLNDSTTDNRVITLKNDLPAFATGGGGLTLIGTTKLVTLQGDGGAKAIGTAGNELASLNVLGSVALNNIDTTNVLAFNILGTTNFVDVGGITNQINVINIGAAGVGHTGAAVAAAAGSYTIDANDGNVGILANGQTINFAHEDATLVLQNSAAGNGTITLNAVLDPGAPNKGKLAVDSGANAGKVILASAGNATYGTAVNRLKQLEFRGNGTFQIDSGIFANDLELSLPAITYNNDINSNLSFGAATALTQNGNINGNVDFNNQAAVITLGANKNITGSVTSTGGVNGTIIATGASTINGPITNLAMLKVGAGAVSITTGGNTSITEIQGNGTALLTLPANFNLTGSINKTGGQALKLKFTNGGSVSGAVGKVGNEVGDITTAGTTNFASSVNAKGAATLGGTTSFADTFTNTGAVTLAKASITNFAKNVTATSFAANNATINFGNSLAFNSNITGSGTTLTLGASQVTYTGTGSFTDTLTLNTTFDGAAKSGGNILIKSGSTLDLSGVSTLALVVTATNFDINNISPDTKYTVISAETAGGLKPTPEGNVKITINNDNRFVDFTFDASTLTLFAEDIAEDVIDEYFEPGGPLANIPNAANIKKSLELMEDAPNGSDARQAFNNFGFMTPQQEADATTHLIQDVVKPSDTIAAINNQVILSNISSSLINLNARMDAIQPAAVAAGDEDRDAKFGAWISPFVGNATQKMRNNISGYKSDTTGGTIGFDGLVNDDLALGLAYTRADTDIKLKNNKTGDKNKVESNIYSVYGLYNVPYENLFVEAIASYSDNRIKSKSRRVVAVAQNTIGYQTANGKYKSESYTGQLMAGYTYMMPENINLTPLAGLRYSAIKDKGYKETGTTNQNLTVKGKNYNSFDGLLGAKVSSNINVNEEVVLTPELYAMVDYAFKNKVPAIDARLQGMTAPFPTNSFKQSKTSFDVGVGVTVKHKMMEYGINYDTNIGSKYFAQQGSVKVRVNF